MDRKGALHMDEDPFTRKREKEPPGIDEIIEDLFGKDGPNPGGFFMPFIIISIIAFIASGFFIVAPAEQAVILRFGKVSRIAGPGPNWVIPVIENRYIVNTQKINSYNYNAEMLTSDESYADVDVTVFFRIKDPQKYLFNDVDPFDSLAQATASALRQVVGSTELEGILTDGRVAARDQIQLQLEKVVALYNNGIEVMDTKLQDAKPPQPVRAAFDDVIQAREDYDRFIMNAESYRNNVVPKAEGEAMRIKNQASAEYAKILNDAYARVAGFNALVPEYQRQPEIMKNQIFIATMNEIYGKTRKLFLSSEGNLNVLPLEKFIASQSVVHNE